MNGSAVEGRLARPSETAKATLSERPCARDYVYQELQHFALPKGFRGRSAWAVQLWWMVQATLFRGSPQLMFGWRRFLLRAFGARIGRGVRIRPSARVTYPWKVSIGEWSWIGDDVVLYSLADIDIGDNVVVSQRSYLCSATHDYARPSFDMVASPVVIRDQAWIAADVFVGPGVTIDRGAVIGARSSVFADVPAGTISIGSPARVVRRRLSVG